MMADGQPDGLLQRPVGMQGQGPAPTILHRRASVSGHPGALADGFALQRAGHNKGRLHGGDAGSMRNLTMELEFRPATGIVTITLPYLPVFNLRAPEMVNFKWEVPSHPAAGGDVLAGTLGGFFDEIPGDFPVFMGHMKTPYDLFWKITFEKQDRTNWRGTPLMANCCRRTCAIPRRFTLPT